MNAMRAAVLPWYAGDDTETGAESKPRPRPQLRMVYRAESPFPAPALPAPSTQPPARLLAPSTQPPATQPPATHAPTRPAPIRPAPSRQASSPLRLTRRGRVVVAVLAALLVAVISLIAAGVAQATSHPVAGHAARQALTQVVVRPGQSLWSVAESADPNADTRVVIQQITELNGLSGDTLVAGQQLWVPRS
jgi:hypothetical protein